jgi:hypothetical protein
MTRIPDDRVCPTRRAYRSRSRWTCAYGQFRQLAARLYDASAPLTSRTSSIEVHDHCIKTSSGSDFRMRVNDPATVARLLRTSIGAPTGRPRGYVENVEKRIPPTLSSGGNWEIA